MSDLEMYRGDYIAFRGVAVQADSEDVYDLTGSKIYFTAKSAINDPDSVAVIAFDSDGANVTMDIPTSGVYIIAIYPIDTTNMILTSGPVTLYYDVQLKTADSPERVFTLDIGTLTVKQDITRRSD